MDDTFLRTMLFDYYGDLLTEKQRECYDLRFNQDLSLQEIAEQYGASRQAVWDLVRRAEAALREFEEKTGLVARAVKRRTQVRELLALAEQLPESAEKAALLEKLELLED